MDMDLDDGGYRQINKALNICVFDEYLAGQNARLPRLAQVEQVSPRVLRVLGSNPGKFTLQGTNTYIVGSGRKRLIVDTSGGEPEWADMVEAALAERGIQLTHVLLTHWHGDHTGGVPDLIHKYPHLQNAIYKNEPEHDQQDITDGQRFVVDGATVRAVHAPGHSSDHMCFVLEEENAMFTGDNILGHGTSAVEDLGIFMNSLEKMKAQHCSTGYSAHGVVIDDLQAKITGELRQKWRREKQVMHALDKLNKRNNQKSATVQQVVSEIYGDSVDYETRTLALQPFIDEVLRKLANDGKMAFEVRRGVKKWYPVGAPGTKPSARRVGL